MTETIKKIREALEKISRRPDLPNPNKDADWKNCMKNSSYEARECLKLLDSLPTFEPQPRADLGEVIKMLKSSSEYLNSGVCNRCDPDVVFQCAECCISMDLDKCIKILSQSTSLTTFEDPSDIEARLALKKFRGDGL